MTKLKPSDTFHDKYRKALVTKHETGLMSNKQVIFLQVLFARESGACDHCGSTQFLTADHIVPALLLKMFGYNVEREFRIEWYQCLCRKCNMDKGIKMEWGNYRTHLILNQIMRERPTWEYTKLAHKHAELKGRFEDGRSKLETPVEGPKKLVFDKRRNKHIWLPQMQKAIEAVPYWMQ